MAQGVGVTIGAESGILAFLKGVTLYLVMGDGGSLHERCDWGHQGEH